MLNTVFLVRKHFANWKAILADYGRGRTHTKFILKDGRVLDFSKSSKRFEFANFARILEAGWKVEGFDDTYMTLKNAITMRIRYHEPPDIFSMREVFLDQTYACDCKGKVVLDVGMFNGDSSIYFASTGARRVIGLEPFLDSFNLAKENIRLNRMEEKIEPINAALDTRTGKGKLSVLAGEVNFCGIGKNGDISMEVTTMTMDQLIQRYSIEIIKMDCEGCEDSVFKSLTRQSLSEINELILEFHNGPKIIKEELQEDGFGVTCDDKQVGILRAKRQSSLLHDQETRRTLH